MVSTSDPVPQGATYDDHKTIQLSMRVVGSEVVGE